MLLVTGGAGFIGSNFILEWLAERDEGIINLDALTYAGNPANLRSLSQDPRYHFVHGDIRDKDLAHSLLKKHRPRAIVHFAAESHVDRSIDAPEPFIDTNIIGTFHLLQAALEYHQKGNPLLFIHVSTDEVYGSLLPTEPPVTEGAPYRPNSPYAAAKASSDHLVRAFAHTYGLPAIIVNCTNNFGPFQFPEKLIPLMICNAAAGKPLPVYGDGSQVRDWLHVSDMCSGLRCVLDKGVPGEVYHIANNQERKNIDLVRTVCALMDELLPNDAPHDRLIAHVKDRPGHDKRYALDASKIQNELGWRPRRGFEEQLKKTVMWYLENEEWLNGVRSGEYRRWLSHHYGE